MRGVCPYVQLAGITKGALIDTIFSFELDYHQNVPGRGSLVGCSLELSYHQIPRMDSSTRHRVEFGEEGGRGVGLGGEESERG